MDLKSIAEAQRQFLGFHASWSISFHTFTGEHLKSSPSQENLFGFLSGRDRFLCDSNSTWKSEVVKPENQSKAFILGHTVLDETDDVQGNIFGKKVDCNFGNIFVFTLPTCPPGVLLLAIERYNSEFQKRFDPNQIKLASMERVKKTDPKYQQAEAELIEKVRTEKQNILSVLKLTNLADLPPIEVAQQKQKDLIKYIRIEGRKCFSDYRTSMNIAGLCHAALLLEQDEIGVKMRKEFNDPDRRNVFGDVLLLRDALWFNARILSNDRAIMRMAEYLSLPGIKVTGMV